MQGFINISLEDIKSNWLYLNRASNGKAAAVIKANSYGMGMKEIAKVLIQAGCSYFYVANIKEGIDLRKKFLSNKISIAIFEGFLKGTEDLYIKYKLTPVINNLEQLKRINHLYVNGKQVDAILNIDTGMNRLGLDQKEISFLLKNHQIMDRINWEFIMSHFSDANKLCNNNLQLKKLKDFAKNFPNIKLSLSNTEGIKFGFKFCLDQTRPGIGLYGIDHKGDKIKLMSRTLKMPIKLFAPILQIRNVDINQSISYGGIDVTKRKSILATLGIGYADGWLRILKPNSYVPINQYRCKIIGNVTMDSFILDITEIDNKFLKVGDYLCILDNSNIRKLLTNSSVISYELFTLMGNRIIRQYN